MSNVVDLSIAFSINKTAAAVLKRCALIGVMADDLQAILAPLKHNEQRLLTAIIAWRVEGGMALPASDLLMKLPALQGLEWGSIQRTAEALADADVIDVVPVDQDKQGNVTAVAFVWPALERLLEVADTRIFGTKLTDTSGNPLR